MPRAPLTMPPDQQKRRLWVLHCPFTRDGHPVVGNFGSTVKPVVILPLALWQQLCADIPALASTQFEVGAVDSDAS